MTQQAQQIQPVDWNGVIANAFTGIMGIGLIGAMSLGMGASFGVAAGAAIAISKLPDEATKILKRSGLGVYKPPPFGAMSKAAEESERKRKPPDSIREREIGSYNVYMETRKGNAQIRLYHYSEGGKIKRIGTWTGTLAAGEGKYEKVSEVIKQVRFEEKTALMR